MEIGGSIDKKVGDHPPSAIVIGSWSSGEYGGEGGPVPATSTVLIKSPTWNHTDKKTVHEIKITIKNTVKSGQNSCIYWEREPRGGHPQE